jgi:hypothetical protein
MSGYQFNINLQEMQLHLNEVKRFNWAIITRISSFVGPGMT